MVWTLESNSPFPDSLVGYLNLVLFRGGPAGVGHKAEIVHFYEPLLGAFQDKVALYVDGTWVHFILVDLYAFNEREVEGRGEGGLRGWTQDAPGVFTRVASPGAGRRACTHLRRIIWELFVEKK